MANWTKWDYIESSFNRHYWTRRSLNLYGLPAVCLLGITANSYALHFLNCSRPQLRSTVRIFLTALSLFDALHLILSAYNVVPFMCDQILTGNSTNLLFRLCRAHNRYLFHLIYFCSATVDTIQIWILMALTCHRYWKICHPFHSLIHDSKRKAKILLITVILGGFLFRLPMAFEYEVDPNQTNFTTLRAAKFALGRPYNVAYYLVLHNLLYTVIPFTVLTTSNLCILRSLFVASSNLRNANEAKMRERRAALAVSFIVSLFLVLHSLNLYEFGQKLKFWILKTAGGYDSRESLISDVGTVLSALSAATNPFIYVALGSTCTRCFRHGVKKLWGKKPTQLASESQFEEIEELDDTEMVTNFSNPRRVRFACATVDLESP